MALTQADLDRILGTTPTAQGIFNVNQPSVSAQKPSSPSLSAIANVLNTIRQPLDVYGLNKNIPVVGGITAADVTGLNQVAPLAEDVAYGRPVVRGGSLQTMQADPRLAGVIDFIPAAGLVAKGGQVAAKAGAREIARQIETGTGVFGKGTIDPREYITAYHGTPHEIVGGKFDLSKIGTGEGNQVYSHGLYFAEHPSVAQTYKMPSRGAEATAASTLKMYKTPEKAIEVLEDSLSSTLTELGKKHTQEAIDLLKSGKATTGNLYKVDIEDKSLGKMLNWDDPISEQNKFIKNVTKKEIKKIGGSANTGGDFYKEMIFDERMKALQQGLRPTQKELEVLATNRLKNLGISGMKYLDAGSRGNVGSTSNYVVYNPETIKILEKNGLLFP